jgi:hypothetical protein
MWNDMCIAERQWCKEAGPRKREFKAEYVRKRKCFDREVKRAKRRHIKRTIAELEDMCDSRSKDFWKRIGKIGVGNMRTSRIPMEVRTDDGNITGDMDIVLGVWKDAYAGLLNGMDGSHGSSEGDVADDMSGAGNPTLCNDISIDEVYDVLVQARSGKATGYDGIPIEALKNINCLLFMHKMFNVCFKAGKVPSGWAKGIINPIPKSSTEDPRDPLSYRGITLACSSYKL